MVFKTMQIYIYSKKNKNKLYIKYAFRSEIDGYEY